MARTLDQQVPHALRNVRDEVLLALFADSRAAEAAHRERADAHLREAVRLVRDYPRPEYDWSGHNA